MADMDLLNAIGELFDKKFEEKIEPGFRAIEERLDKIEERLDKVEERLGKVEERLDKVEERLDKVEERLDRVEERLDKVEEHLDKLEGRINKVEERLSEVENDIIVIRRNIEYKVYPLMDNIWSNYMDTFKRYQKNNEKLEVTYTDIDALKSAVERHTIQIAELQKRIEPKPSAV